MTDHKPHALAFVGCLLLAVVGFGTYAWLGREFAKAKYGPVSS